MRIAVLGAGAMGGAAARLLARHDVDLLVADADEARARAVVQACGRGEPRGVAGGLNVALAGADAVAACLPYRLNLEAMEAALAARVPYADLGGLYHMTLRQLELDGRFRDAAVPAVVGIGMAPGVTNVFARLGADVLDAVASIDMVNGSRDEGFGVPYSAETILDEFTMPAMVFEDGVLREVPAASGGRRWRLPDPVGQMEAVYTIHSELATLPRTIEGVREVRWRLALPIDVERGFRAIVAAGLASEEPIEVDGARVVPRRVLAAALARLPAPAGPPRDVEATEVIVRGTLDGGSASVVAHAICHPAAEGIAAGPFGTALPIAVAVRWLAEGRVPPGVHPPEIALDPEGFLTDLAADGLEISWEVRAGEAPPPTGSP